jgi:cytochrome c oxidase cbb3-type subunit 3/ubiquinol-cytochrome c reductase cytochrome c subunit
MLTFYGCDNMPGRPKPGAEVPRPEQELSFQKLYQENCAGCHGTEGQKGPATNLANPEYQALIDDTTLRAIVANGQKKTMMPGFAKSSGGVLSDEQVDVIVRGIRAQWFKGNVLQGLDAPPYTADKQGDPEHGKQIYSINCARCHGVTGGPPGPKGAILDSSFLALISDQTVRTTAITGRPDLGMPDWRNQMTGHPMSDQDVSDVVAWVFSQRPVTPGHPYPAKQQSAASANPIR